MKRHPPLDVAYILLRLRVDVVSGRVYWLDASKFHRNLVGKEAGSTRTHHTGKQYWIVKIDRIPYMRSHLIFAVKTKLWPANEIDHKNGNSLDDSGDNLRSATHIQNSWNHKGRKKRSSLPMGIRKLPSGRYQARLAVNNHMNHLGSFSTLSEAVAVYKKARVENFGEFA